MMVEKLGITLEWKAISSKDVMSVSVSHLERGSKWVQYSICGN